MQNLNLLIIQAASYYVFVYNFTYPPTYSVYNKIWILCKKFVQNVTSFSTLLKTHKLLVHNIYFIAEISE